MLINENWKVESDALNVILYRRSDPDKMPAVARRAQAAVLARGDEVSTEPGWRIEGFYGTVAGALEAIVTKEVLSTGFASLQLVNARIDAITEDIRKVLGKIRKVPETK